MVRLRFGVTGALAAFSLLGSTLTARCPVRSTATSTGTTTPPYLTTSTTTWTTSTTPASSASATPTSLGSGQCSGVAAWVNTAMYVSGDKVTYNGHLWVANQWNDDEVPGGFSGAWADDYGACA